MEMKSQTVLTVEGMTCTSCVRHINEALRGLSGVSEVQVRMQEKRVVVQHEPGRAPVTALVEALRDAGYESAPSAA